MVTIRIEEDQTIWLALIVSLMMHGLIFVFSQTRFIHHPQFSVQPSAQMVEVSVETVQTDASVIASEAKQSFNSKKIASSPSAPRNDTGVKVKANPDYFQNPPPEYPELAKQMKQEGLVMFSVEVDRTGRPVKVEIIQSSGYHLLDQAALKAVSHWKFQPGSIGGIYIGSTVTVPIRFRLEK